MIAGVEGPFSADIRATSAENELQLASDRTIVSSGQLSKTDLMRLTKVCVITDQAPVFWGRVQMVVSSVYMEV